MRALRQQNWSVHRRCKSHLCRARKGSAALELAILLPWLLILFMIVVDFTRIFYFTQTIENCARAGALYASDASTQSQSPYANVTQAALADATNLSPQPTVSSSSGTDGAGNDYVRVTVTWTFNMIMRVPGFAPTRTLTRMVQMRKVE